VRVLSASESVGLAGVIDIDRNGADARAARDVVCEWPKLSGSQLMTRSMLPCDQRATLCVPKTLSELMP
jgi:hypothetical protein